MRVADLNKVKAGRLRAGCYRAGWACTCTPCVNMFGGEGHERDDALW